MLSTILKNKGYNSKVFIEDISEPDWSTLKDADLIGISSITSTAPRAFQLAKRFNSMGIPVVMGGPHSTFLPEESLKYADYVVRGEGEESIVELIEHLESGIPLNDVKGISYREGETFIHNPSSPLIQDLDAAPIPDFDLVHNWRGKTSVPISTSRGCPFGCRFCVVIQMFGRKYRFKSIDRVIEEIREVASKGNHVFFVDDNFAADRERTNTLLKRLIAEGIKIEWSAQIRPDAARDTELVNLMAQAGCFIVYVGFESINPQTLSLYNKKQSVDDIVECIKNFKNASINIHGMFILGGDSDDIKTIRSTQKFAKRLDIDSVQFLMLTPIPGTPLFEELLQQGRIIHTDWSKYDGHHAVFEPRLMTAFELHTETIKAMAKFYSWGTILKNLLHRDLFYCFVTLYGKRSIKKVKTPSKEYLRELKNIVSTKFDENTGKIREYFSIKKKAVTNIVLNSLTEGGIESKFFKTFFKKIGKKLVISSEEHELFSSTLTIMPILQVADTEGKQDKNLLQEIHEKYKSMFNHFKIIPLETKSLYRMCVDIGLLLGIKMKKVRKAYEKAVKDINGNALDCHALLILISPK